MICVLSFNYFNYKNDSLVFEKEDHFVCFMCVCWSFMLVLLRKKCSKQIYAIWSVEFENLGKRERKKKLKSFKTQGEAIRAREREYLTVNLFK